MPRWRKRYYEEGRIAYKKGLVNEKKVAEALELLKKSGHISHYRWAERNGEIDRQLRADFVVWIEPATPAFLQVKSSQEYRRKHLKKHGRTVPFCVVVRKEHAPDALARLILVELGIYTWPLEHLLSETLEAVRKTA